MNIQPLSHDDAMALTAGSLPQDRPDLVALAVAIDDFRDAFAQPVPKPSPELAGWMTGAPAPPQHDARTRVTAATPVRTRTGPARRWIGTAARALGGLGVTVKIALGGTAALAAVATAGIAGVLPEEPQTVFDRIIDHKQADMLPPGTPSDQTAETDTRPGGGPDTGSGEQRRTEQRSPGQGTLAPQGGGGEDRPPDTTSEPPPSGSGPTADSDGPDDSDREPQEGPDNQSDDESEADNQPDGDDRSQADETEEIEGSSDAAADADGWSNSSDDAEDADAETGAGSSN